MRREFAVPAAGPVPFVRNQTRGHRLMDADSAKILYKRAEIEGNALGDEIVFFDDRVGKYFATGPVGADIWRLLETPMAFDAIVARLLDQYEIDEITCRTETKTFLDQMVEINLVERL